MSNITEIRKLNLGCGNLRKDGWVNLDIRDLPGVDIVRDVLRGLPFENESFDFIYSNNFLEHIPQEDTIWLMNEMWRVMKFGGTMQHIVPRAGTVSDFQDPTHVSHWNPTTILYFTKGNTLNDYYGNAIKGWKLIRNTTSTFHPDLFDFILEKC